MEGGKREGGRKGKKETGRRIDGWKKGEKERDAAKDSWRGGCRVSPGFKLWKYKN